MLGGKHGGKPEENRSIILVNTIRSDAEK